MYKTKKLNLTKLVILTSLKLNFDSRKTHFI